MSPGAADAGPAFLVLLEGPEQHASAQGLIRGLGAPCEPILGFTPCIEGVAMSGDGAPPLGSDSLARVDDAIARLGEAGHTPIFLLPAALDLSLPFKQLLGASMREAGRRHPELQVLCDDVDPCHPLLVHAFVDAAGQCLQQMEGALPSRTGVLLVATGEGDAIARAHSYQLMRLLWEQLAAARGEVAFLRHDRTPLPEQLEACARTGLCYVLVPQFLFSCEHLQFAKIIADDFGKRMGLRAPWPMARPIGTHPNVAGWLQQRILGLWKSHRDARSRRAPAVRSAAVRPTRICGPGESRPLGDLEGTIPESLSYAGGVIVDVGDSDDLRDLLGRFPIGKPETCFVKVTWHGYAPGTYTDAVALDALLSALPGRAVVLEGHTSSRNTGGATFDWELEAREHRAWIRSEEQRYLERTGLREVIRRHGARYLNVTEAYWDGACADPAEVYGFLKARSISLNHEELLEYVPKVFFEHAGAPFISFARFKGPTRLSLSNLFGLIPAPLRTEWHGPNLTYLARVCCDLAKLYGALFDTYGLVEGLNVAVRWDRKGLNRSRWGNYDVIDQPGLLTLSSDFVTADVLASRLQGQDVTRSAFFDVVAYELGLPDRAVHAPIDPGLVRRLV